MRDEAGTTESKDDGSPQPWLEDSYLESELIRGVGGVSHPYFPMGALNTSRFRSPSPQNLRPTRVSRVVQENTSMNT